MATSMSPCLLATPTNEVGVACRWRCRRSERRRPRASCDAIRPRRCSPRSTSRHAEHHRSRRRADQPAHDGQADVAACRRAARSSAVGRVRSPWGSCVPVRTSRLRRSQIRPRRRPRSLCHTPCGSTSSRIAFHSSSRGIATPHCLRGHVRILGEVVAAAGIQHDSIEAVQQVTEAMRWRRRCREPGSTRLAGS